MKFSLKNHINFKYSKSLLVVIAFALTIIINGESWISIQDSYKVFQTELVTEGNSSIQTLPSIFSFEKISSSNPHLNLPFFQQIICSSHFIQKNIVQIEYQSLKNKIIEFDNPTFIAQKRNPFNRSDLPHSIPFNI